MATNNKDENMHQFCDCGMHHGYMGHYGMRWVLGIIILLMVFWLGMKLGEFKGFIEAIYGFGSHGNMMYRSDSGTGMMNFSTTKPSTSTLK